MKGSQESLTTVVVKDAAMWPTIRVKQAEDCPSERNRRSPSLDSMAKLHGQAAPASSSSLGSHQGLWRTPSVAEEKNQSTSTQIYLQNQVGATPKQWATPSAQNHDESWYQRSGNRIYPGVAMQVRMEEQKQWATPRSGKTTDENPETWALRQAKGEVATMPLTAQVKCWGTPAANDANKTPHCEVNSNQAGLAKSVGLEMQKHWATPRACEWKGGNMTTQAAIDREVAHNNLVGQVAVRPNSGKLNPRWVETLMGLPIGWVMPSCKSPVTIEQTNFDSWATESCQQQQPELL
jgi:hypothetical protein